MSKDLSNRKICIIYTGGTIGMVPTEDGFAPKRGFFEAELGRIKDLSSPKMPSWDLIEFDPLLDSTNMEHIHWNQIAEAVGERYYDYDGFVILHGTDTMAYTASALSFMLEGLEKPVVLTGSQIPLCELRSDGVDNIITSIQIAAEGVVKEVCLFFGDSLIRGNRAMKNSADGLLAFTSPNYPPLAKIGININYTAEGVSGSRRGGSASGFHVQKIDKFRVGVIKLFPGIHFGMFAPIAEEGVDGLILEAFGAGNIPSYDKSLSPVIDKAIEKGTSVIVCTQCPQGTVALGAYEAGSALVKAGAISGFNMTTEAAVTKLAYLLSLNKTQKEIRILMETDLRGELDK
ncbi:MAG: asparaginase [Mogibacterium sp.]|nr:asparaginase [Mogibacterium sp.]